jgi:inactivated superfamily I helicase
MSTKLSRSLDDLQTFADLYRSYEELLRLRREAKKAETQHGALNADSRRASSLRSSTSRTRKGDPGSAVIAKGNVLKH